MKFYLVTLLMFSSQIAGAQDFDYYEYTRNAEQYIVAGNFKKANKQYDVLLNNSPSIYFRDMHNAVRCAILVKDFKSAVVWCEKMALKGIPIAYFNAKIFDGLKRDESWKVFLANYPRLSDRIDNNAARRTGKMERKDHFQ